MELDRLFKKAVDEAQYRQQFLDSIADNRLPEYVSKLVYNSSQIGNEERKTLMRVNPNPLVRLYVKETKSKIEVFAESFASKVLDIHKNLDDFLSTLEDHEYFHAKEFYYTPKIIAQPIYQKAELIRQALFCDTFIDIVDSITKRDVNTELRAKENQIKNFPKRECSETYKLYTAINYVNLRECPETVTISF